MDKIIATDLDGTLFYPKDTKEMICKPNLFFLQSFIDQGGEVILISGRSNEYCKRVIKKIGRPCSAVSYNGACIYDGEKLIMANKIPNDEAISIIDEITQQYKVPGIFLMTENGLSIHLKCKSKLVRWLYKLYYKSTGVYAEDLMPLESDYERELKTGNIFKIMIYFGLGKKNRNRASQANSVLRNVYDKVECNWSTNVIEITAKDCAKAKSLKILLKYKGKTADNLYVVGDSGNDISMFKAFPKHSFCMGHAPQNVKKHSKYIIDKFEDLSRYIYEK